MSRPIVSPAAERIYERLAAFQQGDGDTNGWALLHLCEAAARLVARANDALRHDIAGSGWRRMYDPDRCPAWALPWLAQHVGLPELPASLTEAEQRSLIRDAGGFSDGTPAATRSVVAATLLSKDPNRVRLRERVGGDAYAYTVVVSTADTPDPTASEAAARAVKPTGMLMTFVTSDSPLIDEATRLGNSATATGDAAVLGDVI